MGDSDDDVDAGSVDRLPAITGEVVTALRAVGDRLSWQAQQRLLSSDGRDRSAPRLGVTRLALRLRLVKQRQRVLLHFIRREMPEVPVIDLDVRLEIFPLPADEIDVLDDAQPLEIVFEPPPFIVMDPSAEEIARYAADADATPENTVLLRGEQPGEILAVVRPGRGIDVLGADTRIFHTLPGGPPRELEGEWPLEPFRSIMSVLARWARSELDSAAPRPLGLSDDESDAARVLVRLADAYRVARTKPQPAPEVSPLFAPPVYTTTGLTASASLRLDDEGNFVDRFGKDTFQLRLLVAIEDLGERSQARVGVAVPDFLVSGDMLARLMTALRAQEVLEPLAREFAGTPVGRELAEDGDPIDAEDVRRFLDGAESRAIAFRTKRNASSHAERVDTDVFAIRRPWVRGDRAEDVLAVVRAPFRIVRAEGEDAEVTVADPGEVHAMHLGSLTGEGGALDREDVRYFVRLANELHQWSRALA